MWTRPYRTPGMVLRERPHGWRPTALGAACRGDPSRGWLLASLLILAASPTLAQEPAYTWEAEDLAAQARVIEGGDLVLVRSPDPERFPFRGGAVVTFVPRGKGSTVEYILSVGNAGVYKVRLRGVLGPSCGIYDILVNGEVRGQSNWYAKTTVYSSLNPGTAWGIASKLAEFVAGENRLGFLYLGAQGRQGNLVLDTIELLPDDRRPAQYTFDPYDTEIPAGEKHGPELVKNGGFEEFLPSDVFLQQHQQIKNWQFNTVVPKTPCIVRDAAQAHSGTIAMRLKPDPLENNAVIYQPLPVTSGKTYRVSFWARGQGAILAVFYQPNTAKAEDTQRGQNTFEARPDWTRYSYIFQPSLSGKISSAALALYAERDSDIYFDDVSVQEILP